MIDELAAIVRRAEDEQRRRGMVEDTFGPSTHYTSDGLDGHDDYECAARDRLLLLDMLREARDVIDELGGPFSAIGFDLFTALDTCLSREGVKR